MVAPAFRALAYRDQALESLLQLEFTESPTWVVSLVQADIQADCALFGSFSALSAAVLRLVNSYIPEKSSQSPPQWATLLHLLHTVTAGARSPSALSDAQRGRWVEKLEQAAGRVRGARILSKHGMHLPACALTAADRRGACGLLRSMLTSAAVASGQSDDPAAAFGRLWSDCRDLHTYVFEAKNFSLGYLLREFIRAALLAQQWEAADRCSSCLSCVGSVSFRSCVFRAEGLWLQLYMRTYTTQVHQGHSASQAVEEWNGPHPGQCRPRHVHSCQEYLSIGPSYGSMHTHSVSTCHVLPGPSNVSRPGQRVESGLC